MEARPTEVPTSPLIDHVDVVTEFTPGLDYRPVVGLVVAAAAALDPPPEPERVEDVRLAVTEACSNAVKVHRPEAADEPVVVTCHVDAGRLLVEVHDRGPGFDPDRLEPLPPATDPERLEHESGLGVELIRRLADDVTFRSTPDGTVLTMALQLRDPAG